MLPNIISGDLMVNKKTIILFIISILFTAMILVAITFTPHILEYTSNNSSNYFERLLPEPPLNITYIINLFEPWPNTVSINRSLSSDSYNTTVLDRLLDTKISEEKSFISRILDDCNQSVFRDYLKFVDENDMVLGVSIYLKRAKLYLHGGIEKIGDNLYRVVERNISKAINSFKIGLVNFEKLKHLENSSIKKMLCDININDARREVDRLYANVREVVLLLLIDAEKYNVPGNISNNNVRILLYTLQAYLSRLYNNKSSIIMNETIYSRTIKEKGTVWMVFYLTNILITTNIYYTIMKHPDVLIDSVKEFNDTNRFVSLTMNIYSAVLKAYKELEERKPVLCIIYKYVLAKQIIYRLNDLVYYYQQIVHDNKGLDDPNIMLKSATLKLLPATIDRVTTEVILG